METHKLDIQISRFGVCASDIHTLALSSSCVSPDHFPIREHFLPLGLF